MLPYENLPPNAMPFTDSPEAVDRAMDVIFSKRYESKTYAPISDAWKAIIADVTRPPVKLIFDTDIGSDVDDAIALAFALRRPELQVMAITTTRKFVDQRAAIVSRMLQVMGREDVPFAPGSRVMANGEVSKETKPVCQFPFAGPEDDRPKPACDWLELYRRVIEANPGEVWIAVIGTFTNVAILYRDHPDLAAKIKGIVCMAGDVDRAAAETNIAQDPWAADIVFRSGLLKFLGTDPVTDRILVTKQDIDRLAAANTPTTRALLQLIRYWKINNALMKPGPVAFDVCPFVFLFAPELFKTMSHGVKVEMDPPERRGITVLDSTYPPCEVSTDIDAVAVHRLMMDTLTKG